MWGMKSEWHLSIIYEVAESLENVQKKILKLLQKLWKCQWDKMNSIYEKIKPTSN